MIQSGIQDSERALHPASAHVAAHPLQGPPPISVSIPVQPDGRLPLVGARRTIADTDLSVHPVALGSSVFGWTADGET
ncbi:hypothetical protein, partial [Mucilaginibacter sp. 5C4]